MKKDIILCGVGGQGILSIATIIGEAATEAGIYLKQAEVHGMSQRGGSVVTYVKYGEEVFSPIIDKGEADIILAFERLEALRALPYLKKGGKIILNDRAISPMPVITGAAEYPENIISFLSEKADVTALDALELSMEAGSSKAVNVVLIGVLAATMDIEKEVWKKVITETVPQKFLDLNLKAFELGYNFKG